MSVDTMAGLLERERELALVQAALERARAGAGGVLVIDGAPGVGKTALLAHARADARDHGMRVLEARGAALEREFAFGVARQLFERAVRQIDDDARLFAGAAALAAQVLGDAPHDPAPADGERAFGVVHALYWSAVNLADLSPVLVSVDDAHLADRSSSAFLEYLARRVEGLPIALLLAGRGGEPGADAAWPRLAEDPATEVVRLRPLSPEAASEIVRAGLGDDADAEFASACHRATGGNPLFLRELVVDLRDAGARPTNDGAAAVADVGPSAVGRFVLHRLRRLGPAALALSRALAVLGGDADPATAARAAGLDPSEARAAADVLVRAEILAAEQRLRFVHPIVQAAIYRDLLPGERSAAHLTIAELLAAAGEPPERVAAHVLESAPGSAPAWVPMLRAAATDAVARAAPTAAVAYLRRALDERLAPEPRAEILCELGRWELALQEYEAARAHLLAVIQGGAPLAVRARAATWLGQAEAAAAGAGAGSPEASLNAMLTTLDAAAGETALALELAALVLVRLALPLRARVPEQLTRFERRAAGDPRYAAAARIHGAGERLVRGDPAAAVADEVEAALAAGPPADPWTLGAAIEMLTLTDRFADAGRWLELALTVARARGHGIQLAAVHAQRALLGFMRGAVGEAELDAATALELAGPRHFALPRIVGLAIQAAAERGELERAEELAATHSALFDGERLFADELLTARGRLRILRGDVDGGLADLLRCGALLDAHGSRRPADWRTEAAAALSAAGDTERAAALAREAVAAARRFGASRGLLRALRGAGTVIGGDEGLELLEEAAALAPGSPARLEAMYALADLGAELVRQRRRREGREVLRPALEEAVRCGATALADRIRSDLLTGGGRPARLDLTGVDALTPAERRVCELAAGELTNREVAQTLFVTEKTVELHLTSAYRKLGIRSRFQLGSALS